VPFNRLHPPHSRQQHEQRLEERLTELIDAHMDTIGLLVGCDDLTARAAHLDCMQGMVRESKRLTAQACT
jgi:hypothetical protein